jgi:hypothetical protein
MLDLTKVLSEEELEKLSQIRLKHRQDLERSREKAEKSKEQEAAEAEEVSAGPESSKAPKPVKRKK